MVAERELTPEEEREHLRLAGMEPRSGAEGIRGGTAKPAAKISGEQTEN